MRKGLAALAVLFLAAHLPYLPGSLEDIDSINFAMGVRDFDVAAHQPHPPGYPVFIAMAKASTAALTSLGVAAADVRGLAIWSALSGAALIPLLFVFYRALDDSVRRAWWASGIAVTSPLLWFNALRPLSDVTGLAFAVAAQALIVVVLMRRSERPARWFAIAAFIAGLAIGVRSQTLVLTAPLIAIALILPGLGLTWKDRIIAMVCAVAGALVWAIPLVAASGGLEAYAIALGSQAGEDFGGVVMLWTHRTPRVALNALQYTFLWPWGTLLTGAGVIAIAAMGLAMTVRTLPRAIAVLAIAFVPYAIFHLIFQETVTTRYALPLIVPIAWLVTRAFRDDRSRALMIGAPTLVIAGLLPSMDAARQYASEPSPMMSVLRALSDSDTNDSRAVGLHAFARRSVQCCGGPGDFMPAPHGREWLEMVARWRERPDDPLYLIADPRRTDLALFDPHKRRRIVAARWEFPEQPFVGGARPGPTDLYSLDPPGWMLGRGWSLTAEIAGVTARMEAGPHHQPAIAWVRTRPHDATMVIGGRHLGAAGDPPARLSVVRGGSVLASWEAGPGFFTHVIPFAAGTLSGWGYVPLEVRAASASGSGPAPRVSLEQFDVQSEGVVMHAFAEGWQEPEYNPLTSQAWRWMSERAVVWVRPVGRDVTLTLRGESPLKYFDAAPNVRVSLGGREIAAFRPTEDFTFDVVLPAAALKAADGRVSLESDRWFTPAARGEGGDQRHLAVRVFAVAVR